MCRAHAIASGGVVGLPARYRSAALIDSITHHSGGTPVRKPVPVIRQTLNHLVLVLPLTHSDKGTDGL